MKNRSISKEFYNKLEKNYLTINNQKYIIINPTKQNFTNTSLISLIIHLQKNRSFNRRLKNPP